jgi:hypothetical protein
MTVAELIEKLKKMPQAHKVIAYDIGEMQDCDIISVFEDEDTPNQVVIESRAQLP